MPKPRYTINQMHAAFPNDDACLDYLFQHRYANILCCPRCGVVAAEFVRVQGRKCYACVHCRHQLYPMAGTIFHRTTTSLKTWFTALYLFSVSRNGVAAVELERHLGLTHKAAWRMAKQIRSAMKQETDLLKEIVEGDEAYYGGRRRSSNRYGNKTPLLGVVERKGRARVKVTDVASSQRVTSFLASNVKVGSVLHTDESVLYIRLQHSYQRRAVSHSKYEFVRGDDYTNTIEGFWGLLKPSLNGTHRSVSKKYLQLYVNEFVWKYNRRGQLLYPLLLEVAGQPLSKSS